MKVYARFKTLDPKKSLNIPLFLIDILKGDRSEVGCFNAIKYLENNYDGEFRFMRANDTPLCTFDIAVATKKICEWIDNDNKKFFAYWDFLSENWVFYNPID